MKVIGLLALGAITATAMVGCFAQDAARLLPGEKSENGPQAAAADTGSNAEVASADASAPGQSKSTTTLGSNELPAEEMGVFEPVLERDWKLGRESVIAQYSGGSQIEIVVHGTAQGLGHTRMVIQSDARMLQNLSRNSHVEPRPSPYQPQGKLEASEYLRQAELLEYRLEDGSSRIVLKYQDRSGKDQTLEVDAAEPIMEMGGGGGDGDGGFGGGGW